MKDQEDESRTISMVETKRGENEVEEDLDGDEDDKVGLVSIGVLQCYY